MTTPALYLEQITKEFVAKVRKLGANPVKIVEETVKSSTSIHSVPSSSPSSPISEAQIFVTPPSFLSSSPPGLSRRLSLQTVPLDNDSALPTVEHPLDDLVQHINDCISPNDIVKGFRATRLPYCPQNPQCNTLKQVKQGLIQRQTFKPKKGYLFAKNSDLKITTVFTLPTFSNIPIEAQGQDLEDLVETIITRLPHQQDAKYLIVHDPSQKDGAFKAEVPLNVGNRLLGSKTHFAGIHSSYAYISVSGITASAAHREDFDLHSQSLLYAGAPKIWVVVQPHHTDKLESALRTLCKGQSKEFCSQNVRHEQAIIPPSILRKWNIQFTIFVQRPGVLVVTLPRAIHWVLNYGPNYAEASNWAPTGYCVPLSYVDCSVHPDLYPDFVPMEKSGLKWTGRVRPYDGEDPDTPEQQPPKTPRKRAHQGQTLRVSPRRAKTAGPPLVETIRESDSSSDDDDNDHNDDDDDDNDHNDDDDDGDDDDDDDDDGEQNDDDSVHENREDLTVAIERDRASPRNTEQDIVNQTALNGGNDFQTAQNVERDSEVAPEGDDESGYVEDTEPDNASDAMPDRDDDSRSVQDAEPDNASDAVPDRDDDLRTAHSVPSDITTPDESNHTFEVADGTMEVSHECRMGTENTRHTDGLSPLLSQVPKRRIESSTTPVSEKRRKQYGNDSSISNRDIFNSAGPAWLDAFEKASQEKSFEVTPVLLLAYEIASQQVLLGLRNILKQLRKSDFVAPMLKSTQKSTSSLELYQAYLSAEATGAIHHLGALFFAKRLYMRFETMENYYRERKNEDRLILCQGERIETFVRKKLMEECSCPTDNTSAQRFSTILRKGKGFHRLEQAFPFPIAFMVPIDRTTSSLPSSFKVSLHKYIDLPTNGFELFRNIIAGLRSDLSSNKESCLALEAIRNMSAENLPVTELEQMSEEDILRGSNDVNTFFSCLQAARNH